MRKVIAAVVVLVGMALLLSSLAAQSTAPIRYFYDDLGRLVKVVDQNGNWAAYTYDAVGNILSIQRSASPASALEIFNFNPQRGGAGTAVTIQGQGFGPTPSGNQVRFNGAAAAVISASVISLVAIVPSGATSGPISVTVGSATATSAIPFTVVTLPPEDTPPTVRIVSPTEGATVLQGQPLTITVSATGTSAITGVDISVNGVFLLTNLPSPFQATFVVPPAATSLTFGARGFDANGNTGLAAPVTVFVAPDPLTTVQGTVVDGQNAAVAGANVAVKLNGVRGEFFAFGPPLVQFPDLTGRSPDAVKLIATLDFRNPDSLFGPDTFGVGPAISPNFAARFTGLLRVGSAGSYTFTVGASGGATLKVNNAVVATVPPQGHFAEGSGTVTLATGDLPVTLEYFTSSGAVAELQLWFRQANVTSDQRQLVPPTMLAQSADQFTGTTNAAGAFSFTGVPAALGDLRAVATATLNSVPHKGQAIAVPVPGGITDMGAIRLYPASDGIARLFNFFDILDWGNRAAFAIQGDFSIGMWVSIPGDQGGSGALIRFGESRVDSSGLAFTYHEHNQYALRLMGTSGAWDIQYFHSSHSGGPPSLDSFGFTFNTNLPNDTWRYIGLTRVAATNSLTLYIGDGNTLTAYTGTYTTPVPAGGNRLQVGARFTDNRPLKGKFDEHYLWSRALSPAEHREAMLGAPSTINIVLRAPMKGVNPEVDLSPTAAAGFVSGTAVVPSR